MDRNLLITPLFQSTFEHLAHLKTNNFQLLCQISESVKTLKSVDFQGKTPLYFRQVQN